MSTDHDPQTDTAQADTEEEAREAGLDETIAQTFPASDPASSIPNPPEYELLNAEESDDDNKTP
jgi:hypothetical protein